MQGKNPTNAASGMPFSLAIKHRVKLDNAGDPLLNLDTLELSDKNTGTYDTSPARIKAYPVV